jgi:hypothetical protein
LIVVYNAGDDDIIMDDADFSDNVVFWRQIIQPILQAVGDRLQ